MSSAPIGPSVGPSPSIPIGFASGSAKLTLQDSTSLFDFLQLESTAKNQNKQTLFDSQSVDSLVNQKYFLGVVIALQFLAKKYAETLTYAGGINSLDKNYNNSVDNLNNAINRYNSAVGELNSQINTMNNAIIAINTGPQPPTAADIATYNAAVAAYNNYLTSTGNPAMLAYANSAQTLYNNPTNIANTVIIPSLNKIINDLDLGIPVIPLFTPATAPTGAGAQALQPNYSGTPIPLIPGNFPNLNQLSDLPAPPTTASIINTYFLPFAEKYLAAIAATSKKLSGIDAYQALVNFVLKSGFKLDPSKVDSYILNSSKPTLPAGGDASGGTVGSLIVGSDTPNLERILSTALFKSVAAAASIYPPPHVYDQVNALALALLSRIGASAGLSVVKLLGNTLKSLNQNSESISAALAVALLQNILKVVGDGKATAEALTEILKQIPGITQEQVKQLTTQLLASQNLSLLNLGALSTSLLLKNPSLVTAILNLTNLNNINENLATTNPTAPLPEQETEEVEPTENPSNQLTVNTVLSNQESLSAIQNELSNPLTEEKNTPQPVSQNVIAKALQNTANTLPQNATATELQTTLANELVKQNVSKEQAQALAKNGEALIESKLQQLKVEQLTSQITSSLANLAKADVVNPLPASTAASLVSSLTDLQNPNSFASLYASQIKTLIQSNDQTVADEVVAQRRDVEQPQIDLFDTLQRLLNPANNIIMSFMSGAMYDKTIPTNWQKPLQIQV